MPKPSVGVLHRLAPSHRAATPEAVARALVALHSTDPASVHLAVVARTAGDGMTIADVDRALYEDRTIVRVMGMRRTLWAVPGELVPVVVAACGRDIAAVERRRLVAAVEEQGVAADGEVLVADLEEQALAALAGGREALTTELADDVPALKGTVRYGGSSKWAADVTLASRIVLLLTCDGRIVRTRPQGSWTSNLNRYALAPSASEPMETADARAELARRWLAAFGPASADVVGDLKWWTGWTLAATKRALAAAGDVPAAEPAEVEPWAALVPSLDPTTMGWKDRSWYLGDLAHAVFDSNGNAGPAVWWSGRIVGVWAQRTTGEVVTRLLVDVGRDGTDAVEAEAARLQRWLDAAGTVVKPRFRTPLQHELASS
ncbi:MAG TPA: winged helix DNA-binding domain-containing protein [Acidimicrobiales bacterium]|nr:winged helix DNA-binding domain-containing protein [Acidimicrobiales bacterium]